jgi:Pyrimidine reductase, riboflavin biosynthesis
MDRPVTTLFMLMSVDGKITSGNSDNLDPDKDWCTIPGVREGLHQYYEIEGTTDLWSLNTGRVMEKIGVNTRTNPPEKLPCNFVIIDNKPHINAKGIDYMCRWVNGLYIVTNNKNHPAFSQKQNNLHIIFQDEIDLSGLLKGLKTEYGVERITIQSGGTLNCSFLRQKLFDYIDIVVAPLLVGGKDTTTLIDGRSIMTPQELSGLSALKLIDCTVLEDSYIRLRYKVLR